MPLGGLLIAGGVAAAAGIGGAIAGGGLGVGKSKYRARGYGESPAYDPRRFEYGGDAGIAPEAAGRYGGRGNDYDAAAHGYMAEGHDALGDYVRGMDQSNEARGLSLGARDLSMQGRGLSLQSRGQQQEAANLMLDRAKGRNLISSQIAAANRRDLESRLRSSAASARGPAALANAQSDAMAAQAQGLGNINSGEAIAGAQEQQAAEQAAFSAGTGMREGDTALRAGDFGLREGDLATRQGDLAQQGTALEARGQSLNAAGAMGGLGVQYGGLENNVRAGQNQLNLGQQQIMSGSELQRQNIDSGTQAANAGMDWKYLQTAVGGVEGGAQSVAGGMNKPTPKAEGGPIMPGKPYLVGERGPEIIIPQSSGTVIPNDDLPRTHWTPEGGAEMGGITLQAPPSEPKSFKRDTPADQKKAVGKYHDELLARAQAEIDAMRAHLSRGASVARDEGDVDQQPGWLDSYMASQEQPQPTMLAAREEGGPVQPGQPTLVGEKGPEVVIPVRQELHQAAMRDYAARQGQVAHNEDQAARLRAIQGGAMAFVNPWNAIGSGVTAMTHAAISDDAAEKARLAARVPNQPVSDKQPMVVVKPTTTPNAVIDHPWHPPDEEQTPAPAEDPQSLIAKLQAQLAALRAAASGKKK